MAGYRKRMAWIRVGLLIIVTFCSGVSFGAALSSASGQRQLLADMISPEAAVRARAVRVAGKTKAPLFVGPLLSLLDDPVVEVRAGAATALGDIGVPPLSADLVKITAALDKRADDPQVQVAKSALKALARFPFPEVRQGLLRRAKDPKRSQLHRDMALEALASADPVEAQRRLGAYLSAAQREVRRGLETPDAMFRWGVPQGSLLHAARDLLSPSPALHWGAVQILASHPNTDGRLDFLSHALKEPSAAARRLAAGALSMQGDLRAAQALVSSLADVDPQVREAAAKGVASRQDSVAARLLVDRLALEPEQKLQQGLRDLLSAQPVEATLIALEGWPGQHEERVARQGVLAAGVGSSTAATRLLVRFVAASPHPRVVELAAAYLVEHPDAQVVPPALVGLADLKVGSSARYQVSLLLSGRKHPRLVPALLQLVRAGESGDRVRILLAEQPEELVRPGLLSLVDHEDANARRLALHAAQDYQGPDALAAAAAALQRDPSDNAAFRLLDNQDPLALLPIRLRLLADDTYRAIHPELLWALRDTRDPGLPGPVARAVSTRPALALEAINLLNGQPLVPAVDALGILAAAPGLREDDRAQAVLAIAAFVQTADSEYFEKVEQVLLPLAKAEAVPVRYAARNALHELKPATYPSWDPHGRTPLIAMGAAAGAGFMVMVTDIADAELSPAFVGGAGAVLGAATPFLLTLSEEVTQGGAGVFGTYGAWATGAGYGLGLTLGTTPKNRLWLTIAGETLGVGAGALGLQLLDWGMDDVAFANVTATQVSILSAGISSVILQGHERRQELSLGVGLLSGAASLVPLALLTRDTQVEGEIGLLSTSMLHGAWLGAFAPGVFFDTPLDGQRMALGAAVGQSAGYLAGVVWSQVADLNPKDAGWSVYGAIVGASALGGMGLLLEDSNSKLRFGLLEAGSAVGALSLGLFGRDLEFRGNDGWLVTLMAMGGAVAGSDLSVRIEEDTVKSPQTLGGALMGAGFGTAAGLVLTQFVDVSDRTLGRTLMGGGLGAAAGFGLGRMLPDLDVYQRSRMSTAMITLGLGLTLPWAESLELSAQNYGYATASAGVLGGLMALTPYYYNEAHPPAGQMKSGALFGASIGAFAGLGAAQGLDLNLKQTGLVTLATIAATGFGGGLGLVIPTEDRRLAAGLAQGLGAATFATASGLMAADIWKTSGRKKVPGGFARASGLALHGALHGSLIPATWRQASDTISDEEVAGGVMLGASAGVLMGLGARGLGAPRLLAHDVFETSLLTTTMYAVAGGIGLAADDRRLGARLIHGLGLPAYAAAWLWSPHTHYDSDTSLTLTLGLSAGAWLGAWTAPLLARAETSQQVAGAGLAGAGLGALAGAAWTQLQSDRQEAEVLMDGVFGAALGGGVALVLGSEARRNAALVQAGSVLGLGLGLGLAPYTDFSSKDRDFVALSTLLGAWHGAWTPDLFGSDLSDLRPGASLIGASVGFAGGSLAAQFMELDRGSVSEITLMTAASEAFGTGLGFAVGGLQGQTRAAFFHGAGAAGFASAAWLAPRTKYEKDDGTLIVTTALFGGLAGVLAPSLWTIEVDGAQRRGGLLAGAGAGALVGTLLTQTHRLDLGDQLEGSLWGMMGASVGSGTALLVPGRSQRLQAALVGGGALLGLGTGIAMAPNTEVSGADGALYALSSSLGAWHGGWLPAALGDSESSKRAGGALLGMGAGWVAAAVASPWTEIRTQQVLQGGLLWGAGTGLGAGLGLLLPEFNDQGTAALMEGLGAAGLITGIVLSDRLRLDDGDLALVPASTLLGAGLGLTLPTLVGQEMTEDARGAGVLLGASAGLLASFGVAQFVEPSLDEVMEASAFSLVGQGLGFGLGWMLPDSSERQRFALLDGAGAAGLAAGLWLAPYTDFDDESITTLTLGAALGAGFGGLTPAYWNGALSRSPGEQLAGGVLVGATLGLGTAMLLDQAADLSAQTRNQAVLGAALGTMTGGGLGLLFSEDDRVLAGLSQGLGVAGALAIGNTMDDVDFDATDLALGGAYVGYLTWHSMGLTLLLDGTPRQAAGVAIGTLGLGAVTGMYLGPYIDMSLPDTLMLLAGNVWGTWIGGWGGALLEDSLGQDLSGKRQAGLTLVSTVLGSDIGLALTGMVVGGWLDVPPTRFAYINLGGLSGMLLGMVGAGFAKGEPLKAGNVLGSLSGLLVGTVVTGFFDWSASPTWDTILSKGQAEPQSPMPKTAQYKPQGPLGFGIEHWMPSAQVTPNAQGEAMYMFTVSGIFR